LPCCFSSMLLTRIASFSCKVIVPSQPQYTAHPSPPQPVKGCVWRRTRRYETPAAAACGLFTLLPPRIWGKSLLIIP
jgi:hypothetical protein